MEGGRILEVMTTLATRATRLLLAATIAAASLLLTGPARASESGDIPGTPLLGGAVEAQVGGPIVDLVYSIQVPAASVLVATVRGEPGAELGLYLYGEESSSILTALPLTSSAKPGGVQSVSVRIIRASTLYINVNGRNSDRAYGFTLLASILRDETPPLINSALANSRSQSGRVCVAVRSADPISGITGIRLTDELGGGDADWISFTGSGVHCTALAAGDGSRALTLRTRNGVDLASAPYRLTTIIDDAIPELIAVSPGGNLLLAPRGAISWRFDGPVTTIAPLGSALSVFNQAGRSVEGKVTRSANRRRFTWTPSSNIPTGSVLLASLGGVRDSAGNTLDFTDTRVITRKNITSLRIAARAAAPKPRIMIIASANMLGQLIVIEVKSMRGWTPLRTMTLTTTSLSVTLNVDAGSAVRATFAGSDRLAPSSSTKLVIK